MPDQDQAPTPNTEPPGEAPAVVIADITRANKGTEADHTAWFVEYLREREVKLGVLLCKGDQAHGAEVDGDLQIAQVEPGSSAEDIRQQVYHLFKEAVEQGGGPVEVVSYHRSVLELEGQVEGFRAVVWRDLKPQSLLASPLPPERQWDEALMPAEEAVQVLVKALAAQGARDQLNAVRFTALRLLLATEDERFSKSNPQANWPGFVSVVVGLGKMAGKVLTADDTHGQNPWLWLAEAGDAGINEGSTCSQPSLPTGARVVEAERLHYIKINEFLEEYARQRGASEDRWREEVYEDLTQGGTCLRAVRSPNAEEDVPLLRLYGDRWVVHAVPDKFSKDQLFLTRINHNWPSYTPRDVACWDRKIYLTSAMHPRVGHLHPVRELFDGALQQIRGPQSDERRHYFSLGDHLEPHIRRIEITISDWRQTLLDDLTRDGKLIRMRESVHRRAKIGIVGRRFYCEAQPHGVRTDTIEVLYVAAAVERDARYVELPGEYQLLPQEPTEVQELDSALDLWAAELAPSQTNAEILATPTSLPRSYASPTRAATPPPSPAPAPAAPAAPVSLGQALSSAAKFIGDHLERMLELERQQVTELGKIRSLLEQLTPDQLTLAAPEEQPTVVPEAQQVSAPARAAAPTASDEWTESKVANLDKSMSNDLVKSCRAALKRGDPHWVKETLDQVFSWAETVGRRDILNDPFFVMLLGEAHSYLGDTDRALEYLEVARDLRNTPSNLAHVSRVVGKVQLARNELRAALEAFKAAATHEPHPASYMGVIRTLVTLDELDPAVEWVNRLLDVNFDNEPWKAETLAAQVYWKRYRASPSDEDLEATLKYVRQAATSETRDHQDISYTLAWLLAELVAYPGGQALANELVRWSPSAAFTRALGLALYRTGSFPTGLVDAALERSLDQSRDQRLTSASMKLIARRLLHAYFKGPANGAESFTSVASDVFERLLVRCGPAWPELYFEILVAERDAVMDGLVMSYSARAQDVFEPLFKDTDKARSWLSSAAAITDLNDFLRLRFPQGLVPDGYSHGSGCSLARELRDFVEDDLDALRGADIDGGCSVDIGDCSVANVSGISWLRAKQELREIFDFTISQLSAVRWSSWSARLACAGEHILLDLIFQRAPAPPWAADDSGIDEGEISNAGWHDVELSTEVLALRRRIKVNPVSALPESVEALGGFVDFLAEESEAFIVQEGRRKGFYADAQVRFQVAMEGLETTPTGEELATVLASILDSSLVVTAKWLFMRSRGAKGRHPRGAIHELKKLLVQHGGDIPDSLIDELRGHVLSFYRSISSVVKATVLDLGGSPTNLRSLLDECCSRVERTVPADQKIELRLACPPDLLVETYPRLLNVAICNLLENAEQATERLGVGGIVLTQVQIPDYNPKNVAVVTITNPYDPDAGQTPDGTGIGSKDAAYLVEEVCGGTLTHRPRPEQKIYEVVIELPLGVETYGPGRPQLTTGPTG